MTDEIKCLSCSETYSMKANDSCPECGEFRMIKCKKCKSEYPENENCLYCEEMEPPPKGKFCGICGKPATKYTQDHLRCNDCYDDDYGL